MTMDGINGAPADGGIVTVGIGEVKVIRGSGILRTLSLGSCVGIVIYDEKSKVGGLAHIMLPDSSMARIKTNPAKFADTAVRLMVEAMVKLGALPDRCTARIAGGACMFESAMADSMLTIGERNIMATRKALQFERIPLVREDTGKNYGRTLEFYVDTGRLLVSSALHGVKVI